MVPFSASAIFVPGARPETAPPSGEGISGE